MDSASMDQIDRKIIAALQANARLSNAELADRVGLSASPCLRRVRLLEERGLITGYRALVDRRQAGLKLTVFVELSVSHHNRANADLVEKKLARIPGAVTCHMVSGKADFLLELAVPDLETYEAILSEHILTLDEIDDVRSNFSLRSVKVDGALDLALAFAQQR